MIATPPFHRGWVAIIHPLPISIAGDRLQGRIMHPINYVAITYASAALKGSDIQINAKGKLDRTLDPETLRCGFEGHILNTCI